MLRRLSIQNRTPGELRQLAVERRDLASCKDGSIRTLLLNEAKLLEFHAELRSWTARSENGHAGGQLTTRQGGLAHASWLLSPDLAPFITKLSSRMGLSAPDQHAILSAALPPRQLAKDECIVEEGELPPSLLFLCSGTARSHRTFEDGSQQIVAVFLAGDALNPADPVLGRSRNTVCALAPSIVLEIPAVHLPALLADRPEIVRALWMETAQQAAIQREWMIWLGRRTAQSRVAHFLCEVSYRLQLSGDDHGDAFQFPLTQRELADTLGLSTVHVNRVLQSLRSQRLIELTRNRLIIRDKEGLCAVAEFDPGYLDPPAIPLPKQA